MELRHVRSEVRHTVSRSLLRENAGQQCGYKVRGWQPRQLQAQLQTLLNDFGRERTGPARIGTGQDELPRHCAVPTEQLQRQHAAKRQTSNIWVGQLQCADESVQTVCI